MIIDDNEYFNIVSCYLDQVRSQLKGCGAAWQDEQIEELRQHLDALIAEQIAVGIAVGDAVDAALGRSLRGEWVKNVVWQAAYRVSKYGARTLSVFVVGLAAAFAIGEGVPKFSASISVHAMSLSLLILLAGLIIGWRKETIGGATSLVGFAAFCAADYLASGMLPRFNGLVLTLFLLPPALYLLAGFLTPSRRGAGLQS
jgi:hypothetical protein